MGYCPTCKSEYQPEITQCAECGVPLVDALTSEEPPDLIPVFRAESTVAANRIAAQVLGDFEPVVIDRTYRPFPTPAVTGEQAIIVVPADKVDEARARMAEATADGVLSDEDGEPIEE